MTQEQTLATFTGKCLCGAVSLSFRHTDPHMSACHCNFCRRWGGGPFLTVECHQAPDIEGAEHITVFRSSDWAERGFCSRCGTHLFYRLTSQNFYALPAGLFEKGGDWPFRLQVFIDQKPQNYNFDAGTKTMTGEEVFKAWGA